MGILMEATDVNLGNSRHRRIRVQPEYFGAMGTPGEGFFSDAVHTIAINTRETEFGSIVEPIPITYKTFKELQMHGHHLDGYEFPSQTISAIPPKPLLPEVERPSSSSVIQSPQKAKEDSAETQKITRPPPKKKWIKAYLEEEPKSPVSVRVVTGPVVVPRVNGVRAASPLPVPPPPALVETALALAPAPAPAPLLDFSQEHSRPRTSSNSHGSNTQIPSPPSVSSTGSGSSGSGSGGGGIPRAGTREVHNKLEKNRRAHLKECFDILKRQLPATPDDKKTSNLSILGSAIRYIQLLRRKERDCEHEMERLAREKIAAQQRLAALKREVPIRATVRPRSVDGVSDDREDMNGQVLGIPISITSSPPHLEPSVSPPRTLNLSTKLRTLPIQITPTSSQVVRTSYASRHNTLTFTTLTPAEAPIQNGQSTENGVTNTLGTLVHPAQIHLPLSQVVGSGGLVVTPTLQLLSTSSGLRVVQAPVHTNGVTSADSIRLHRENGFVSTPQSTDGSVVVSQLPLVVSQPSHILQHTFTHKSFCPETISVGEELSFIDEAASQPRPRNLFPEEDNEMMVETQMVKSGVSPITVSAQYLSAAAIVKPVVVMSSPPASNNT